MYRSPEDYDKAAITAIQIYEDYGLNAFPLDPFELCKKMGIKLIPYSILSSEEFYLSMKKSTDGYSFLYKGIQGRILYNDCFINENICRVEFTILHEIKHVVDGDYADDNLHEDMADYFAKYMKCPIPYLIVNNITDVVEIMRTFHVNQTTADIVSSNITRRFSKYGNGIFKYEIPLLQTVLRGKYDINNFTVIDSK